jgi:hypothetical protein
LVERLGLVEEMRGARDDDQLFLAAEQGERGFVPGNQRSFAPTISSVGRRTSASASAAGSKRPLTETTAPFVSGCSALVQQPGDVAVMRSKRPFGRPAAKTTSPWARSGTTLIAHTA